MNLIDTHAHLNFPAFKPDLEVVLKRAKEVGVAAIINVGSSLEESAQAIKLESKEMKMYATVGIHPHEAIKYSTPQALEEVIEQLYKIYSSKLEKIVGIGECGLDFFFQENPGFSSFSFSQDEIKEQQKKLFQAQIDLAKKLNLPLIIHCRNGWEEIFNFDYSGLRGVFHSFSSTWENAQKVLALGFYLGFNCTLTYPKNDQLREVLDKMPLEKILTETDCPFLPPQNMRGQRNEPANVAWVVKTIAEVRKITFEEAANVDLENARIFWKLDQY